MSLINSLLASSTKTLLNANEAVTTLCGGNGENQKVWTVIPTSPMDQDQLTGDLRCSHCAYTTELKGNLRRHIEQKHINPKNDNRRSVSCLLCEHKAPSRPEMNDHYGNVHNVDCSVKFLEFENIETFEEWKTQLETNTRSRYVRVSGARRTKNAIYQNYICHRSGSFMRRGKGKRRVKTLGSNKINGFCPSQINVTIKLPSGTVAIKYISTHVGHTHDLGRLSLSNSDREMIAQELSAGVSWEKIICNIRNSVPGERRVRLVTRQDVVNIARDFKINSRVVRQSSDGRRRITKTKESSKTGRDTVFEQHTALHEGDGIQLRAIQERHDQAVAMSCDYIALQSPTGWSVHSGNSTESYDITKSSESCTCSSKCSDCGCCIHRFTCSCEDSAIEKNMCKHIHLVILQNQNRQEDPEILDLDLSDCGVEQEPLLHLFQEESTEESEASSHLEAMVLDRNSVKSSEGDLFQKQLREMDDLIHQIIAEVKTSSDAEIALSHLRPILPAIANAPKNTSQLRKL